MTAPSRLFALTLSSTSVIACATNEKPSVSSAPSVVTVASAPSAAAPVESSAPPPEAPSPPPPTSSPPPAEEPPAIACKTVDDCWLDDAHKPMKRPAKLRGRKVAPCKDGEHAPACVDGTCIVRAYKC